MMSFSTNVKQTKDLNYINTLFLDYGLKRTFRLHKMFNITWKMLSDFNFHKIQIFNLQEGF